MKNTKKLSKRSIVKGSYKHLFTIAMLMLLMFITIGRASAQQAYAVLTENSDGEGTLTLTFRYDKNKPKDVNTIIYCDWAQQKENITQVVFEESFAKARPTTCAHWFNGCTKLT